MNILLSRNNNFGDFVVALGGNRTLGNPTVTGVIGKKGRIRIVHSDRTLAFGSNWEFAGGTAPTLSTTASAKDVLSYVVLSSTSILATLIADVS